MIYENGKALVGWSGLLGSLSKAFRAATQWEQQT